MDHVDGSLLSLLDVREGLRSGGPPPPSRVTTLGAPGATCRVGTPKAARKHVVVLTACPVFSQIYASRQPIHGPARPGPARHGMASLVRVAS